MITTEPTYERLVERSFEKIRQAGRGMPAIMIRQLDALAKITERAARPDQRRLLLDQAAMIERLATATVHEESDLDAVRRAFQSVLDADTAQAIADAPVAP